MKPVTQRGPTIARTAKDLDVGESTLGRWVRVAQADAPQETLTWSEREELQRLRRENDRLREEREIPETAAAFFAREIR